MFKKILVATSLLGVLCVGGVAFADSGNLNSKVAICHLTSSDKNPYVEIIVSLNAVETHLLNGDTILAPGATCGDISPDPSIN